MNTAEMTQIAEYAIRGMSSAERKVFLDLAEGGEVGFAHMLVEMGALRIINRNLEMASMAAGDPSCMAELTALVSEWI